MINLQRINREAKIFDSIRSQIDAYRKEFQAVIQAEEDELRKADRELARQRTILAPEAYAAERQKFEKRIVDFQRRGQKRKQDLDGARTRALVDANNIVRQVVADIATEYRVNLILRSDLVAYYIKAMDMTDVVLQKLKRHRVDGQSSPAERIVDGGFPLFRRFRPLRSERIGRNRRCRK